MALLVIDMQIGLVDGAHQEGIVLDRIADLIDRARHAKVPVIHVQHHHATYAPLKAGAPTWHLHPRIAPVEGERVIGKTASDAFHETHNAVLPRLAHPSHRVIVRPGREVVFAAKSSSEDE